MTERPFRPRALGEIAIRCRDFAAMQDFYGRVLGLSRMRPGARGGYGDGIAFYHLGDSFGGHVAVLALFADQTPSVSMSTGDAAVPVQAGLRSSLHHLALSLPWDEQDAAAGWLVQEGYDARFQEFAWAGWRGLFTRDPDGNTVELVAASPEWHVA
ncbi:VOC family protein [Roseicitreum antarcticum]|uniref:Catechol 2,3-dioxygenase n=1 Tax=Roseicitreum antarcticum TaxID=564137 RepID=A0A1H2RMZ8_9RHOB|nr:VOC family protein [Roseicitreum antarcticum]SDW19999.1 Catechol 2,3-dioxygenase [Roseicitreum antarcticum]